MQGLTEHLRVGRLQLLHPGLFPLLHNADIVLELGDDCLVPFLVLVQLTVDKIDPH